MRPHRAGCRALALLLVLAATGTGLASPAAAAGKRHAIENVVSIFGEAGDPITGGKAQVWRSGTDVVTATTSPSRDEVRVRAQAAGGERFDFRFQARQGEDFTFGMSDTAAVPTDQLGALTIIGGGRTCADGQTGHFRVVDTALDLSKFWILFEHRCTGSSGSSFGEVQINQPHDRALLIAPSRVEFPGKEIGSEGTTVPITLINTGSAPIAFQSAEIVGRATRTTANPVIDDNLTAAGTLTYVISGNSCASLQPGERCTVLVTYRPLIYGPVEAYLRVVDALGAEHRTTLSAESRVPDQTG